MSDNTCTVDRVGPLRERMARGEHTRHRIARPDEWRVADMDCSLPERKAHALRITCERMPIAIEPDELIVGMRTVLSGRNDEGGYMISADTLRAAQADPDAYGDLVVRVWGFCERFVALSSEYQQEIIDRTAHAV